MPIADKTGEQESITEVWRALRLFTNRRKLIRNFVTHLNQDPNQEKIIYLYGDGGNGKSLLVRYLREYCTKRFSSENWEYLQNLDNDDFMNQVKNSEIKSLPFSAIDFGLKTTNDDRPQEAFYGLLMMRRQLANYKIKFPHFDFACVWYLHRTNQLNKERLKSLFPAEEVDFLTGVIDAASGSAYGAIAKSLVNVFFKHSQQKFTLWWQKRGLNEIDLQKIISMDAETDLVDYLPVFFANDLNFNMSQEESSRRVVLFFDTHESFWGSQKNMPRATFFKQDEWLRRLVSNLDLPSGITVVIAGRERPQWAEASKFKIPEEYIEAHLVGHLSRSDANEFLKKAQIEDEAFRQSLIDYAEVETNEVHPLYLGLCVDVILAAERVNICLTIVDFGKREQTLDKERDLVDRLLKYVDSDTRDAVVALSACRNFNKEIFIELGKALNFHSTDDAFKILLSFSFVWQAEKRGEGWYRIHQLLRELFVEQEVEKQKNAHEVLERYYRNKVKIDETAIAEAIYHTNQIDWERGVIEWAEIFDQKLQNGLYEICNILIEVLRELKIHDDFYLGWISFMEGNFQFKLSNYDEAIQDFNEAIKAYNEFLLDTPNDLTVLNNKGIIMRRLGDMYFYLSNPNDALNFYQMALKSFDEVLKDFPDFVPSLGNKGNVLFSIGDTQVTLTRYNDSLESYQNALFYLDKSLKLSPKNVTLYNNKGLCLQKIGHLQEILGNFIISEKNYRESIKFFNKTLNLKPDFLLAIINKSNSFRGLGDLQNRLLKTRDALKSYQNANKVVSKAIEIVPNDIYANNTKIGILIDLFDLQVKLSNWDDSVTDEKNTAILQEAINICEVLLAISPYSIYNLAQKSELLNRLGIFQMALLNYSNSISCFEESIQTCDKGLSLAPNHLGLKFNKATALLCLADSLIIQNDRKSGCDILKSALELFKSLIDTVPSSVEFQNIFFEGQKLFMEECQSC